MKATFEVLENNAGGIAVFVFDKNGKAIDGVADLEYARPGEWNKVKDGLRKNPAAEIKGWEGHIENPALTYANWTSHEFGFKIVADSSGVYPPNMGEAARLYFGINHD